LRCFNPAGGIMPRFCRRESSARRELAQSVRFSRDPRTAAPQGVTRPTLRHAKTEAYPRHLHFLLDRFRYPNHLLRRVKNRSFFLVLVASALSVSGAEPEKSVSKARPSASNRSADAHCASTFRAAGPPGSRFLIQGQKSHDKRPSREWGKQIVLHRYQDRELTRAG